MKIKSIEYYNFRNFKEKGKLIFDTSGKISVIYGKNGDGKTTLHQLFQWVLYGSVNFNKTTSKDKIYNLESEKKLKIGNCISVFGQIEYEHEEKSYLVRREDVFEKTQSGKMVKKESLSDFFVMAEDDNGEPRKKKHPELVIESMIPRGLSSYFFFDGETMIADLKKKGTESANKLKEALFTIFDLELIEAAIKDIGTDKRSQSVLGLLNKQLIEQKKKGSNEERKKHLYYIEKHIKDIEEFNDKLDFYNSKKSSLEKELEEISQRIGEHKSKKILEDNRKTFNNNILECEKNIGNEIKNISKKLSSNCAYMLIGNVAKNAKEKIYFEVQNERKKIIAGLEKELLINLLNSNVCICGNCIGNEERKNLLNLKNLFPPSSYKSTYDKYESYVEKYNTQYDISRIDAYFKNIISIKQKIKTYNNEIEKIDEEIRETGDYDDLIERRLIITNNEKPECEKNIKKLTGEIANAEQQLEIRKKKERQIAGNSKEIEILNDKIEIYEKILSFLKKKIKEETEEYRGKLENEITYLLKTMLTSNREVTLTSDFQLQVVDSYGDESKSEGQFAVVTFAYIIGILKVLKEHEKLRNKEFPLVLDGPFSKLDAEQKKNVIDALPMYVPQVIIFSKDSLYDVLDKRFIGKEYTIQSNEEKNIAKIEEGYLWN